MILHTLSASDSAVHDCLRFARKGDAILCLDDSVTAMLASRQSILGLIRGMNLYVCRKDLAERGIAEASLLAGVVIGDDNLPVMLSIQAEKIIHWG